MATWSILTNHGRALLSIANDPDVRLRDLADELGITERTAFGIVNDLASAGYVKKDRDGRRNRYEIQEHVRLDEAQGRDVTLGQVLGPFVETTSSN